MTTRPGGSAQCRWSRRKLHCPRSRIPVTTCSDRTQLECQGGAGGDRLAHLVLKLGRNLVRVDDRVAPLVQLDQLGYQLSAYAMAGAGDRVHDEFHASPSTGRNGRSVAAEQPPRACRAISVANTTSALPTNRAVPSG